MARTTTSPKQFWTIVGISAAVVILASAALSITRTNLRKTSVYLGGQEVSVVLADTPALQAQGLSGYSDLGAAQGMLFVFPQDKPWGFWMKDMRFAIDIIWFDANRHTIYVKEGAEPSSYPEVFMPATSARYVLEVQAGFFAKYNIKIGDTLEIAR